jgi:NAD(P)-dependent dehydrogenase (short-subunit alcohol dehydrogenase family)
MIRFDGEVALVTGAGRGLGRAFAQRLAERGARVIVNNRHRGGGLPAAESVAGAIRARGGEAVADLEPVEAPGAGERLVERALARFGRLDALICNAGVSTVAPLHRSPPESVREQIEINLLGALGPIRAALAPMRRARHGRVLVVTSSAALCGDAGFAAYAAAKSGLWGLVRSLAHEGRSAGIRCNALLPFAHTEMTRRLFEEGHFPADWAARLDSGLAADLATWLVSRECELSGETLLAIGRVVARAALYIGHGIELAPEQRSPEALAGAWERIAGMFGAREFDSGAALLRSLAQRGARGS